MKVTSQICVSDSVHQNVAQSIHVQLVKLQGRDTKPQVYETQKMSQYSKRVLAHSGKRNLCKITKNQLAHLKEKKCDPNRQLSYQTQAKHYMYAQLTSQLNIALQNCIVNSKGISCKTG